MHLLQPFLMLLSPMVLGGLLYFKKTIDDRFINNYSRLVVTVTYPAMLFVSVYTNIDWAILRQGMMFPVIAGLTCIFLAITANISGRFLRLEGQAFATFRILCTNGNNIFLPVPIILSLFGPEYVVFAFLFELGAGLFYWSYGVLTLQRASSDHSTGFNWNFVILVSGLVLGLLNVPIPEFILGGLKLVSDITVGSAMLILGALVTKILGNGLKRWPEVFAVLGHRFVLSPLIAIVSVSLLSLDKNTAAVLILLSAMPPLTSTALLAATLNVDQELATLGVVIPTVLSLAVVPLILLLTGVT